MGQLTQEEFDRFRFEGRSEQEIAYYDAKSQKDYENILKDPNTPESVITDMVDRITLVPLKILALKHQNISMRSIKYILEKADNKPYQESLIETFWLFSKHKTQPFIGELIKYYNVSKRFQKITNDLLEDQIEVTSDDLSIYLLSVPFDGMNIACVKAVLKHKNFDKKTLNVLSSIFFNQLFPDYIVELIKISPMYNAEIMSELFDASGDDRWLSTDAKDIFLF